jgi:hypothetical protein
VFVLNPGRCGEFAQQASSSNMLGDGAGCLLLLFFLRRGGCSIVRLWCYDVGVVLNLSALPACPAETREPRGSAAWLTF